MNMICHSHRPLWWKVTHSTDRFATELNTGRERPMKSHKDERKSIEGAMPRCEVCKWFCSCAVPWVSRSSVCSRGHGVCGLRMLCVEWSALAGSFHPSFLCSASESKTKLKPKALWWTPALSLASRAGAPHSGVCRNVEIVNGRYYITLKNFVP